MSLNEALLNILACPACHGIVKEKGDLLECQNAACKKRYPIRAGIPVMLINEAV